MANLLTIKKSFIQEFKARATTIEACAFPSCPLVLQMPGCASERLFHSESDSRVEH